MQQLSHEMISDPLLASMHRIIAKGCDTPAAHRAMRDEPPGAAYLSARPGDLDRDESCAEASGSSLIALTCVNGVVSGGGW